MLKIILFSTVVGVVGTSIGGLIGLIFGNSSKSTVSYLLSLASGVMISIVTFDLIPETLELSSLRLTIISIVCGVLTVQVMNYIIDKITDSKETHVQLEELRHQKNVISAKGQASLLRAGIVMFAAIALHNLPEGMAIGSGGAHSSSMGAALAIVIALHNIPEGMSIGVPLIEGGMNKYKAVLLTALSGLPTLFGGLLGAALGNLGQTTIAFSLSFAGGAMLYVTFCEIIPQAILLDRTRKPALFTISGLIIGLSLVELFAEV